jgi:hypothetical protein
MRSYILIFNVKDNMMKNIYLKCRNINYNKWTRLTLLDIVNIYFKVWIKKIVNFENFVFVISQLNIHPIFKILVSTPHNYPLILGGRHKNFEDWMNIELLNYKREKIQNLRVFLSMLYSLIFLHSKSNLDALFSITI